MVTAYNQTENVSACENSTYTYPDGFSETITANTSYTSNLVATSGCDSTIVTNVTMELNYNLSENVSACENTTYTYPDGFSETIVANTSHTSNLNSVAGCDSTIITNVTMESVYNINESVSACENSTYTYPDGFSETITASTSYTSNLFSAAGCDSVIVTNVTMQLNYNQTQNLDVCSGSTFVYPDGTVSTNILVDESYTSNLNSVAGCDSIIVTNLTVAAVLNYTNNVSICSGEDYTYPDGNTSTNIIVDETNISNLVSQNGCDSIITTNLTVNPIPNVTANNATICNGESVDLTATPSIGGGSYLWSPGGETTPTITVSPGNTTTYSVVYTLNGCESNSANADVTVNPMPIVTTSESNNVITADQGTAQYQWLNCDTGNSIINGETGQSFTPTANGNYAVQIDLNGCIDTSACVTISTIGLDEIGDVLFINVYPNPVSDELFVSSSIENVDLKYQIIDAQGRLLMMGKIESGNAIDVTSLTSGMYVIHFNEGYSGILRFVKK